MIVLRRHRLVLGAGAAVVLAAAAVWLVAFSAAFGVGTVRVEGVRSLSAGQVQAAARIPEDTPLVRLDGAAVARRVERLPQVARASVRTSFPSTVIISITERVPVGYVQAGADFRLVDLTGSQYRTVTARPAHLPQLVVPGGAAARPTLAAVATVADALPGTLLGQVASVQALDPSSITLLLTDRRVVRWGSADHNAQKARILPTLLDSNAAQIDVTDPDLPYTR